MKRLIFILCIVISLVYFHSIDASIFYVTSLKAVIYEEAHIQSEKQHQLRQLRQLLRGSAVTVLSVDGAWSQIRDKDGRLGWMYSMLLSKAYPEVGLGRFESVATITKSQRVRASMYSNSAAARGLLASSVQFDLKNNFQDVLKMESLYVTQENGWAFINKKVFK
jgi:SH3-like domain-containing protein